MRVKGTTKVEVDINLKSVLIELYDSKVGRHTSVIARDNKYYLEYSDHIENMGNYYTLTETSKNNYDALVSLRDLITNFDNL